MLAREDQDEVLVQERLEGGEGALREGLPQVDARDLGAQGGGDPYGYPGGLDPEELLEAVIKAIYIIL